jgi:hypothetical protein
VALVVVWVWGTAAALMSAGDRSDVLVVAGDVGRFEPIERPDLRVARVGADGGADTLAASELDEVVGRRAATDLVEGSVLAPSQVLGRGERLLGEGEALVGARLKPGELPSDGVGAGAEVFVVVRPAGGGEDGEVGQARGWVWAVGEPDASTGERSVSLVVPASGAGGVSAAAADGRVSLVVLEG